MLLPLESTFTREPLEDGVISYDCKYCGHSSLEKDRAICHAHKEHLDAILEGSRLLGLMTADHFKMAWVKFVMRRIPKREKDAAYFKRVFHRDMFAAEAARRGL